ncbi:FtsQ-type POTRA domain-containing protein [Paenibacillus sp. MER TA 81-3]|uniref:cell division protein FtsQ/DivIB n=1 Tax=Paenibacillus sp. MER TA 81-3 TaxID=2939573 RepID=UPI0020403891|nr:FtsQ-type POTRA domain-containing protein [Paenibacillus sp. MER TA 81-3]MCM3337087.1 FtsQ-type POTRA domain-containing protein [Paenibacillus sp. MER TA 81-3]
MNPLQARTIPPLPDKPQKKKRKATKLIWLLFVLFIVLLGVLFFRSPISKISQVRWIGEHFVTQANLTETSGLRPGEPFFGTSSSTVAERIQAKYPFVKSVQVDKQFPGLVEVHVHEYAAVAYELTADGMMQACLENGSVVKLDEQLKTVLEKPMLTQWDGQQEMKSKLSKELANIPKGLLADISEIRFFPSSSYPDRIKLYTRSGFEVVTSVTFLHDKIAYLSGVVETQEPGRITMLKADSYIPYSSLPASEEDVELDSEGEDATGIGKDRDSQEANDIETERLTESDADKDSQDE